MGREALDMSVSPRQNFSKPPPVPDVPTVTRAPRLARWNSSATASPMGKTVDEPSIAMTAGLAVCACCCDESLPPPHAAHVERTKKAESTRFMPSAYGEEITPSFQACNGRVNNPNLLRRRRRFFRFEIDPPWR